MGSLLSCFSSKSSSTDKHHHSTKARESNKQQPQQISQQDMTILKLKSAQDKMLAQKKSLQKNADKAAEEAKQYIAEKKKQRAMFSLKRQKLYEQYLSDMESKYLLLQKSINDLESAIMTSTYTDLLKDTNDLIKEIESTNSLEQLQEIAADMKEREQKTKEFNALFNEHNIEDEEIDQLYNQFEGQVVQQKISFVNKEKLKTNVKDTDIALKYQQPQEPVERRHQQQDLDEVDAQLEALAN